MKKFYAVKYSHDTGVELSNNLNVLKNMLDVSGIWKSFGIIALDETVHPTNFFTKAVPDLRNLGFLIPDGNQY